MLTYGFSISLITDRSKWILMGYYSKMSEQMLRAWERPKFTGTHF